ncbi:ABC transporter ATP-binding protein [Streptacidiphilus pinicola]|uniref:ABC transporter ATP-binding protein n=1 Tax=Streptacidiphilus pinicola TaxID=2219663 RepID=UPI001FB231B6|nr:ABC transporter ATP-binding protein [Streptacidiphilus pinicola]
MTQTQTLNPSKATTGREVVLEIRGLDVDYGFGPDAVRAVSGADLTLHRGEVLGLAGESGSGKSTLAYALTRLLRAPGVITGGEVLFHSRPQGADAGPVETVDILAADAKELGRMRWSELAVVFQSAMHALNPVARIDAQLTDVLKAHRRHMSPAERRERAVELLRMVGISADRLRSYPHELSGGMRQRVMIAMSLALEPQVVIMDEPTTALDVVTQREILEELMLLRERLGFAVVFITHDLSLLLELADSIAVMYAGRIVERASAAELFRAPRHPYSLGLKGSFPSLHGERVRMEGIPGAPPSLKSMPSGCAFHPRCKFAVDRCKVDLPPLATPAMDRIDGLPDVSAPTPTQRVSSCWLHDGQQAAPDALALPFPTPVHLPDQVATAPNGDTASGADRVPSSTTVTHPTLGSTS